MYLLYETSSVSESNGSVIIPEKNTNGTVNYTTYTAKVYITEEASIWKEYSYGNEEPSGEKYTYEKQFVKMDLEEFIDFCIRNKKIMFKEEKIKLEKL